METALSAPRDDTARASCGMGRKALGNCGQLISRTTHKKTELEPSTAGPKLGQRDSLWVFAQPTASTAEQPIAATLPQCSTPSQSSGAAARLKSANLSTASGPAAYLGPILSATKRFACPLFIGICRANPLHTPGLGILRRPPFSRWSQANLRPYQAPNAACTAFPSTVALLWRFLRDFRATR